MENKETKNAFSLMEEDVLAFWEKSKTFEKSVNKEAPRGDYVFYDGPPFATGMPHYGHLVASIIKDVVPRYWTMKGYRVERKWGWDCHGLPIENIVEKEMGSKKKKDIEAIGVKKFNELCRAKVMGYVDDWKKIIRQLGRWADMENSYKTMDLPFMESVWYTFKELWDKNLIYKGHRPMHVCPRCETTLSQSEVSEGYKDVEDTSVVWKFKVISRDNTYLLAWTTTPWSTLSTMGLSVGPDFVYLKIRIDDAFLIFAKERLAFVMGERKDYEIVEEIKGSDLVGLEYEPLVKEYKEISEVKNNKNVYHVFSGDYVEMSEGTGIVTINGSYGEIDMEAANRNNLPIIMDVNIDGHFNELAGKYAGMYVVKGQREFIKDMEEQGMVWRSEKYLHSYPHCWRCDTPLLNYSTSSWFVKVTEIKSKMLEYAKDINWSPAHIKEGRWGKWLEGARDWSISRQRFWASVMPIWECECGELKVIGSVKELEELSRQTVTDLHKDFVDEITIPCSKCGKTARRIPDVLDTWFDSGSMPYAQMHYPFENKEKFEKNFPAQFIAEGADQTRCWFYYMHVIATGIKKTHAFNNVIVNGIVLAEDGKKMSKKLQNYPDPVLVMDKYGSDALRQYLLNSPVMLADNLCFSEDGVKESLRKNIMILWNVYKFYEMFADGVAAVETQNFVSLPKTDNVLDQWIITRLNQLVEEITGAMDGYDLPRATRPITAFIDDLSTWYIRRSRDRFKDENVEDKKAALETTGYVLLTLSKLIAPFMPFMAENLWQRLTGNNFGDENKSVHLEGWPAVDNKTARQLDNKIIDEMMIVRKIVELGLAKRDEAGVKVRQPLQELRIKNYELRMDYVDLVKDELNVKEIKCEKGEGEISVELDFELTEELKLEGVKRELVRFINATRKDAGLSISDRVNIYWQSDGENLKKAMDLFKVEILKDTLAVDLIQGEDGENKKEVKVNGEVCVLGVKKV